MTKLRCLAIDDEPFALEILADDIELAEDINSVNKIVIDEVELQISVTKQ